MLPSLFISHGSPALGIMDNKFSSFFKDLSKKFEKPKYIIIVSAHWESQELLILSNEFPKIIYDFYGFPKELHEKKYQAKNSIKQVKNIKNLLKNKDIDIKEEPLKEGYDHGVWVPLSLMYPKADIPIIQISLPKSYTSKELFILGEALQELRNECLIIGSGSITHNLYDTSSDINAQVKEYAEIFDEYISKTIKEKNIHELLAFKEKAPKLRENHPSQEHFMPLFFPLGAAISRDCEILNKSFMYGNLSMQTLLFSN